MDQLTRNCIKNSLASAKNCLLPFTARRRKKKQRSNMKYYREIQQTQANLLRPLTCYPNSTFTENKACILLNLALKHIKVALGKARLQTTR